MPEGDQSVMRSGAAFLVGCGLGVTLTGAFVAENYRADDKLVAQAENSEDAASADYSERRLQPVQP